MTTKAGGRFQRWCLPDMAMTAALLTLLYLVLLFDGGHRLFRDSDSGWHIRTGERILRTHALPRLDPYSFGKPHSPWVAWEWLSDVAMGALHSWAGLPAVAALYIAAIALCTWLWFQLHWQLETNFLIACALAAPMLSTANIHWLARPHIFSWVLLLTALLWLEHDASRGRPRSLFYYAALAALWANLHASFFLLPLLTALFIPRLGWMPTLATTAATFLNPYGWNLHAHLARYLTNNELLRLIGEFQSFNFHSEGATQIALALLLSLLGAGILIQRGEYRRAAIAILFSAIAIRSARGLPLMALAALPYAGRALSKLPWPPAFPQYAANLRTIDQRFSGTLCVLPSILAAWLFLAAPNHTGFPPADFPVQATPYLSTLPTTARLFAPDKFGGYIIYATNGQRPVFFDGRSDYYGASFLRDYISLVQVRPNWLTIWQRHRFTHALLPINYSLNSVLPSLGWKKTYQDHIVVVWTQP